MSSHHTHLDHCLDRRSSSSIKCVPKPTTKTSCSSWSNDELKNRKWKKKINVSRLSVRKRAGFQMAKTWRQEIAHETDTLHSLPYIYLCSHQTVFFHSHSYYYLFSLEILRSSVVLYFISHPQGAKAITKLKLFRAFKNRS